jgi:hypothetical protein
VGSAKRAPDRPPTPSRSRRVIRFAFMRLAPGMAWVALCATLPLASACGGASSLGNSDGGSDSATESNPGRNPRCPSAAPTAGAPCTPSLSCEYPGDAPHGVCSISAACAKAKLNDPFTWFLSQRAGCGVNPSTCPAAFSSLAPGSPCPGAPWLFCNYQEGACGCVPCMNNGGAANASMWACRAWGPDQDGCPPDPPLTGDACAIPDQVCSYGLQCVFAVGSTMLCRDGYWAAEGLVGSCRVATCNPP